MYSIFCTYGINWFHLHFVTTDELNGSVVLDFNTYATLQTNTSDVQQDPAFEDGAFGADSDLPVIEAPATDTLTAPPPLPLPIESHHHPLSSVPADCDDGPLLADADEDGSDDPSWENFSDLEFPRDTLDVIDTLGNSSFGQVHIRFALSVTCVYYIIACLRLSYFFCGILAVVIVFFKKC